jgi:hypothetical protein
MSISVSPFNPVQQAGCRAKNPPDLVIASRAPGVNDYGFFLGTVWLYEGNSAYILGSTVISPTTKSASWLELSAGASTVSSVTGTANQITASPTTGAVVLTIPSTFTAPGSITATAGNITATSGNFVSTSAGDGLKLNSPTASGAASGPVVVNGRSGSAIFTGVSIAAGASLTLTITNSAITASTTQVIYSLQGATAGAALTIVSVTNSSGSSAVVVTNGTGATTTTANIALIFLVLN